MAKKMFDRVQLWHVWSIVENCDPVVSTSVFHQLAMVNAGIVKQKHNVSRSCQLAENQPCKGDRKEMLEDTPINVAGTQQEGDHLLSTKGTKQRISRGIPLVVQLLLLALVLPSLA